MFMCVNQTHKQYRVTGFCQAWKTWVIKIQLKAPLFVWPGLGRVSGYNSGDQVLCTFDMWDYYIPVRNWYQFLYAIYM